MSFPAAKLLDQDPTFTKQSTSHFLIDNSCAPFGLLCLPTSKIEPPTSSPNRPSPRLEIPVSHRKQRIGPISNRPYFAFYNSRILGITALVLGLLATAPRAYAQKPDLQLLAKIQKIKAIDNHSHPPKVVAPGEKDDEYDALPCDPLEPTPPPATSRPDNPQFLAAWKALWGYPYNDMAPAHIRFILDAKARIQKQQGDNYPDWVLDHLGIETELANREALGRGLRPPRFRWVPFDDALLLPLNNDNLASETPDRKFFYGRETQLLARYMKTLGLGAPPASLDDYLSKVVTPTLEDQKKNGAVAIKFEAAYLRSLEFAPASIEDAQAIYARYAAGGAPPNSDYITLQNYIFRRVAAGAGKLGMPVHIHTGFGCGGYFDIAGANPALLESVFDDPSLRGTNFVILHGGAGPYSKSVAMLLVKPNVYTDFSEQTWLLPTRQLSQTIRYFLETFPEKVLFGTDLYPGTPEINWEEVGWQTTNSAREALAIALTGMMDDGEISRARALELAKMVLRGNALKLYGWPDK
ncbi:MAG TPA: amidohydrolase family protein [Candidatus Acidoferrales bacterium]|nr:amidohydrolase family protein [Candidatus Acidoferrales bacterium]